MLIERLRRQLLTTGFASPEGKWIIEAYGVDPDIVVENDPKAVIEGCDPQLERGVAEVLQRIRQNPKQLPKRPAPPMKTRWMYEPQGFYSRTHDAC